VIILVVEPGGAASSAGLLAGDVILRFGGAAIMTRADIQTALDGVVPNVIVPETIWRSGHAQLVEMKF
jgi:serine protease Do